MVNPERRPLDLTTEDGATDWDVIEADGNGRVSLFSRWDETFFSYAPAKIDSFLVGLGTAPGTDDIISWHTHPGDVTHHSFGSILVYSGVRYFVTISAINNAGLRSTAHSDGFISDHTAPMAGIVRHGRGGQHQRFHAGVDGISANWNGFMDLESGIDRYQWAVSSDGVRDDVQSWENVGLATSASSALPAARMRSEMYILVRASNRLGKEVTAISPVLYLDTTPPEGYACSHGTNLISAAMNPSFEMGNQTAWDIAEGTAFRRRLANGAGEAAYDGESFAELQGAVSIVLADLRPGAEYRLILHAQELGAAMNGALHVSIDSVKSASFPLRLRPAHSPWHRVTLNFRALTSTHSVILKSIGGLVGLDGLGLTECIPQKIRPDIDIFDTDGHFFSAADQLHISWSVEDEQSEIQSCRWAAGVVKGGQQLSPFSDVGALNSGVATGLELEHGTEVHFTVSCINGAGLRSVFHSSATAPTIIDLSPPTLQAPLVWQSASVEAPDNMELVEHSPFIHTDPAGKANVNIALKAVDGESGIVRCDAAFGGTSGASDVLPYTGMVASGDVFFLRADIASPGTAGAQATVRCYNGAGLATQTSTCGVFCAVLGFLIHAPITQAPPPPPKPLPFAQQCNCLKCMNEAFSCVTC